MDAPVYIVAAALAEQVAAACKLGETTEIARFKGATLDRVTFQHPFLERSILGVLATYVTADTGTGAVHTAPSHGADDFYTGQRYDLDPICRVDAGGHIHCDASAWPRRRRRRLRAEGVGGESSDRGDAGRARRAAGRRAAGALVSALLALPSSGDLPRDGAVVHRAGHADEARRTARRRRSANLRLKRSTRWCGTRHGARSGSRT